MARELTFAYPGDLNTVTGGYLYDKRIISGLQTLGWAVQALSLDPSFPWPSEAVRVASAQSLAAVDRDRLLVIDGLALGALGEQAATVAQSRPFIALVHHPLAHESGLSAAQARQLFESEREALRWAQAVIVTSPVTASTVQREFDVPAAKLHVVLPGVDKPAIPERQRSANEPLALLSVGALVPRKAFDVLISALGLIPQEAWQLVVVGDDSRSPETTEALRALVHQNGLSERVRFTGAVTTSVLAQHYARADCFVLASRYEGYGMAFAEALAWGLPVVGTTGGAIASTVPADASLLVEPDDVAALARALRTLCVDPAKRQTLALAARAHASALPDWDQSASQFAAALSAGRTQSTGPHPERKALP